MSAGVAPTCVTVVGSGTDAGKTFVACRLIEDLHARGHRVGVRKPVVSGYVDDDEGSDPARLMAAAHSTEALDRVSPWRFADAVSPDEAARRANVVVAFDAVVAACHAGASAFDVVVTETAGGVMSPLTQTHTQLDLVVALGAPVILVVDASYLGCISHGLTAWHALSSRAVDVAAVVVNRGSSEPFSRFLPPGLVCTDNERARLATRIERVMPSSLSSRVP